MVVSIKQIIDRIRTELSKIAADSNYENDDEENAIFAAIKQLTGWDPDDNEQDQAIILSGDNGDRLEFALKKLQPPAKTDEEVLAEIEEKIKTSCSVSKYMHLCQRIHTASGLAYVVNRCIHMMAKDLMHLSAALAQLEAEEEGIN